MDIRGDQSDSKRGPRAVSDRPESQPTRAVLGGADIDAQDFAVALGVDPDGDQACTLTNRPPSQTLSTKASAATNVYGPAPRGRVRKASTAA